MATTYSFRLTAEGWDAFARDMQKLGAESTVAAGALERLRQASPALQTAMERAQKQTEATTTAMVRHVQATGDAASTSGRLGNAIGQAGFQIQDFAVQVQGGTSALVALSQQGSQFLGLFGTGGAIAGAVLTVGLLAAQFLGVRDATDDAKKAAEAYAKSVADLNDLLETAWQRSKRLADERVGAIVNTQTRVAEAATARGEQLGQRVLELERQLADAERQRGLTQGSGLIAQAQDRTIADLRRRLESARGDADAATREAAAAMADVRRAQRINTDPTLYEFGDGMVFPEDATSGPLQRMRDEARRAAERSPRSSGARAPQEYGPGYGDFIRSRNMIWEEENKAAQAAQRALEQTEQRRQQSFDRTVETYSRDLARGTTDALFDGFKNGEGFARGLGSALERALRTAVAGALDTELFRPLISSLFTGLGFTGATDGAGGSGGGMLGGLGQMLGLSGIGRQLSSTLGLGDIGLGGIGSTISGWMNTPLWGGVSGGEQAFLAAAGVSNPASVGATTIGGLIGAAGLGFGAGSLAGNLTSSLRGTQGPGGMIGAGVGTLAGLAFGPVGALIGGIVGGAGGGLFGPTQEGLRMRTGGQADYGVGPDGRLVINRLGGKRIDEGAFRSEVQAQLDQINSAIGALGLVFTGGAQLSVGTGPAAGSLPNAVDPSRFTHYLRSASGNELVNTVLRNSADRNGNNFAQALEDVDWLGKVYEPLIKATEGMQSFHDAVGAMVRPLSDAIERAEKLGLATDALNAKRQEEIDRAWQQRANQIAGIWQGIEARRLRVTGDDLGADLLNFDASARSEVDALRDTMRGLGVAAEETAAAVQNLLWVQDAERQQLRDQAAERQRLLEEQRKADAERAEQQRQAEERSRQATARGLLETLTFGSGSALSPEARGFAALSALNAARRNIGGQDGLNEYVRIAQSALPTIRDVFGTTERYGSIVADVAGTLRAAVPGGDNAGLAALLEMQAAGGDRVAETILSVGGNTNDILSRMLSEMAILRGNIEALARRVA